jgi:tetratricopeptide (TPR) repeat protein
MSRKVAVIGVFAVAIVLIAANLLGVELNAFFVSLPGIDKAAHVVAYAFAFACIHSATGYRIHDPRTRVAVTAVAGLALSLTDELLQTLAPGRNVELYDLVADWAGLTIGWVLTARPSARLAAVATTVAIASAAFVAHDTYTRLIDYSRAIQAERKHDFAGARVHYERALANGLHTAAVYNGIAWVTVESGTGSPLEAVEYGRKAFELEPDNPDILDTYGWALHRAGRSREGLPHLLRAFDLKPAMFCIHYHLGETYQALGDTALAEKHLEAQVALKGTREAELAAQTLSRTRPTSPAVIR